MAYWNDEVSDVKAGEIYVFSKGVHHIEQQLEHQYGTLFQRGEPPGLAAPDHTVPYGTVLSEGRFPGTSCPATIVLSLWDEIHWSKGGDLASEVDAGGPGPDGASPLSAHCLILG